jgi:hypothetical protein
MFRLMLLAHGANPDALDKHRVSPSVSRELAWLVYRGRVRTRCPFFLFQPTVS